jgi:hypothetical protein
MHEPMPVQLRTRDLRIEPCVRFGDLQSRVFSDGGRLDPFVQSRHSGGENVACSIALRLKTLADSAVHEYSLTGLEDNHPLFGLLFRLASVLIMPQNGQAIA